MKRNKYWEVDLEGTRLDDFAYVKAPTARAAKSKVYKVLLKDNGGDKSLVPDLTVKPARLSSIKIDLKDTGDFPYVQTTKILGTGRPIFDFEGFYHVKKEIGK
jgi:hypothetical protein